MPSTRRAFLRDTSLSIGAAAVAGGPLASLVPGLALGQTADRELARRIHADLVTHESFGWKFSGGPGDNSTASWIANRLRASGYQVAVPTFEAPFFVARETMLSSGSASVGIRPQAPVVPTAPDGVTARLALIEAQPESAGPIGDVRGRIALIVAPFGRHAALFPGRGFGQTLIAAAEAGAAAIVVVTTGPSREAIALNCPEEPFVPIPAAVIAPKHSEPFIESARAGREANLVIDGDATHRPSPNVIARLERGDKWLAISTPRSGWYQCVAERGTGTAAFLEIADWARDRYPQHSVFLMNTGGHEYFFAGSHHALHEAPPPDDTLVWMHIGATLASRDAVERDGEWVMLDTPDPQRRVMATVPASAAAEQAFAGLSGMSPPSPIQAQAGELSTFTGLGYSTAFAAIGVHRWFHTTADTLNTVDAGLVVPVVRAHQRTVELLLG